MIEKVWANRGSVGAHKTIESFEYQQNRDIPDTSRPAIPKDLKAGQQLDHYQPEPETKVTHTLNDKIVFANGGSIEDQSSENGRYDESGTLLLKSPDGSSTELDSTHAWVDIDNDSESDVDNFAKPAVFFKVKTGSNDYEEWKQTFPSDGGTMLTPLDYENGYASFQVSGDGKVSAQWENYGDRKTRADGSLKNGALVAESGKRTFAIVPPVPVEWLVS